MRIIHESERGMSAGTPIIEIGGPNDLEIVVDYLSSDSIYIEPGQRDIIDEWGGDYSIGGIVQRVEPFGYTKTSALGIKEQRVNVIIDLTAPKEKWQILGH